MSKCPKCSTDIGDDYGMATCSKCGAIVFVDMDGVAQVAGDSEQESRSSKESPPDFPPLEFSVPETPPAAIPSPGPIDEPFGDMNAFLGYGDEAAQASDSDQSSNSQSGVSASESSSQIDPKDPLGISAYANSEVSSAQNGPLVVSLTISGIDAKDLRDEIRQALQDSRFGWDAGKLLSEMKGGVLRLDRISPVKATVIINRIKNLSVRIRWEQSAITDIDPVEKEP